MSIDMRGKTCVVTGATSGIGFALAGILAGAGARVICVGRDESRCAEACASIAANTANHEVSWQSADLSSVAQVRDLAAKIRAEADAVDVLVNNAGTFTLTRRESIDGNEMQLAVNWLSGFVLTGLLMPLLRAAGKARVVAVSSGSHFSGRMHWDDIHFRRGYRGLSAYDQSKLATVLFTYELARRLGAGSPVSVYAVDPGLVRTDIGKKGNGPLVGMVWKIRTHRGISPWEAAAAVAYCAAEESAAGKSGFYWKEGVALPSSRRSYDIGDAARLWELGETLGGLRFPAETACGETYWAPQSPEPHLPRSHPHSPV
jgi:NAD(P)-dependent dehydrogenase (short-subunit alcohol dehydrogenase family)